MYIYFDLIFFYCLEQLHFKDQITLIRDWLNSAKKIEYLQLVKLIILEREMFDMMIAKSESKQEAEIKLWTSRLFSECLF